MKKLIEINNLSKYFGSEKVLEHLSLDIVENEILVIMGPSGVGKSTLLNIIGQLEPYDQGTIVYHPELTDHIDIPFPFVFQSSEGLLPWKTVSENIRLVNQRLTETELRNVLQKVSLENHRHKYPHELSGGMKQRVSIARALVCHSKILFMDEPFGSLDPAMREKLQDLILELQKNTGLTIVFVTHDSKEAQKLATRLLTLSPS